MPRQSDTNFHLDLDVDPKKNLNDLTQIGAEAISSLRPGPTALARHQLGNRNEVRYATTKAPKLASVRKVPLYNSSRLVY